MKIHLIPSDSVVGVDGISYFDIDLSWIPEVDGKVIHAVHWDDETEEGEVEFVGPAQPLAITSFGVDHVVSFLKALSQWQQKRDEELEFIRLEEEAAARMQREMEERMHETMLDFNREHLSYTPREDDEEEGDDVDTEASAEQEEEDDLFYDIEELLKEI